jgi:hypothetical protein
MYISLSNLHVEPRINSLAELTTSYQLQVCLLFAYQRSSHTSYRVSTRQIRPAANTCGQVAQFGNVKRHELLDHFCLIRFIRADFTMATNGQPKGERPSGASLKNDHFYSVLSMFFCALTTIGATCYIIA